MKCYKIFSTTKRIECPRELFGDSRSMMFEIKILMGKDSRVRYIMTVILSAVIYSAKKIVVSSSLINEV